MKTFINHLWKFIIPGVVIIVTVTYLDFFKIFGYQDYYTDQIVGLNREVVTTTTFNHFKEQEKFNSFIFGNSRSQAYKCMDWKGYLDQDAKPFHFDAHAEVIWGVHKKIEYIDEMGVSIDNALLVVDRALLSNAYPRDGHLVIPKPSVSKGSYIDFYYTFLIASLNPKFLIAHLDYSIFNEHRRYMGELIKNNKYDHIVNRVNCDMWYGMDKEIEDDSIAFYANRMKKGIFYTRPTSNIGECKVTPEEIYQLKAIKKIFTKHNTKYKIIVSPIYDQVPLEDDQLNLLGDIFGHENIYNFSGKNRFTDPIYNYYESSHYRPHVAKKIMKLIFR